MSQQDPNTGTPLQTHTDLYKLKNSMSEQLSVKRFINLPYDNYKKDDYSVSVYFNGSFFLFELEQLMGEEKFFSMLQNYYKKYKFSEVKTEDFLEFVKLYDNSDEIKKIINKYIQVTSSPHL